MCMYCKEAKALGDWEMVRLERFESVMKEHYHQEGITFSYPPMCKFRDGLQLLKKLIDAQLMRDDLHLFTQNVESNVFPS